MIVEPHSVNIESETQTLIALTLPDAIGHAIQTYYDFYGRYVPDDPKEFTAYQNGCKAALAHIQLLMKLTQTIDYKGNQREVNELENILISARNEIDGIEN
jgi:hypothetical protein